MTKRRATCVAILLIIGVCVLSTVVVAHSDGLGHNEEHCTCQLCHIQHAAVPQPSAPAVVVLALCAVRRICEEQTLTIEAAGLIPSVPRAPPA